MKKHNIMLNKITETDKQCRWYNDTSFTSDLVNELLNSCNKGNLANITSYILHDMVDKLYEKVDGQFNIYIAVLEGSKVETINHLLKYPETYHYLNKPLGSNIYPINLVVKKCNYEILQKILELNIVDVNIEPVSALMTAISINDINKVKLLLKHNANIWQVDEGNFNAIDLARDYGHVDIANVIELHYLNHNVDDPITGEIISDLFSDYYKFSLFLMHFPTKILNTVITHGTENLNIMEYAISVNNVGAVETLLRSPKYPIRLTSDLLLHIDFTLNVGEMLELFEHEGIGINSVLLKKVNGVKTISLPLYYCTKYYENPKLYDKYFQALVKYGADIDACNSDGINPLIYAALHDTDSELMENILEFNPHVTVKYNGKNVFELITERTDNIDDDLLELFSGFFNRRLGEKYDYRAPVMYIANNDPMKYTKDEWIFILNNFKISSDYSYLFDPKYYESKIRGLSDDLDEDVCDLIDNMMKRINDLIDSNFQSVLTYFIVKYFRSGEKDDFETINNILESDCNVHYINVGDPMTIACEYQMEDVIDLLLHCEELCIPVNYTTYEHCLFSAIRKKNIKIVNMILRDAKINIEQVNFHGDTPLLVACNINFTEGVRLLLKYGANVNVQNDGGQTPLMLMAMNQNVKSMNDILRYRPNVKITDVNGETYKYYMMMPELEFLTFMNL